MIERMVDPPPTGDMPQEAELIVLRYGEWMRSGAGPGPKTAREVLTALAALPYSRDVDTVNERLTGAEASEVIRRHVARYEKAIELAGRTGGLWWDVACGTGYGMARLPADAICGFDRPGTDILTGMDANFLGTDIAQAGWSSDAPDPDVVVSIETLEHLNRYDQDGFIAEIAGRLKPDGVLVLACPIGNGPNPANPWHLHESAEPELRTLMVRHFLDVSVEVESYESTSGPAVQAWATAREPV